MTSYILPLQLTEVGVTESGEEVILDSSTGIVTLRLLSRDKPAPQAGVPDKSKVLYNGTGKLTNRDISS